MAQRHLAKADLERVHKQVVSFYYQIRRQLNDLNGTDKQKVSISLDEDESPSVNISVSVNGRDARTLTVMPFQRSLPNCDFDSGLHVSMQHRDSKPREFKELEDAIKYATTCIARWLL